MQTPNKPETSPSAPQRDSAYDTNYSVVYQWLQRVSQCGLPDAEYAARSMMAYYQGAEFPEYATNPSDEARESFVRDVLRPRDWAIAEGVRNWYQRNYAAIMGRLTEHPNLAEIIASAPGVPRLATAMVSPASSDQQALSAAELDDMAYVYCPSGQVGQLRDFANALLSRLGRAPAVPAHGARQNEAPTTATAALVEVNKVLSHMVEAAAELKKGASTFSENGELNAEEVMDRAAGRIDRLRYRVVELLGQLRSSLPSEMRQTPASQADLRAQFEGWAQMYFGPNELSDHHGGKKWNDLVGGEYDNQALRDAWEAVQVIGAQRQQTAPEQPVPAPPTGAAPQITHPTPLLADFLRWAEQDLGQGYSLEMEEGTFTDRVTRWAFHGYRAGRGANNAEAVSENLLAGLKRARTALRRIKRASNQFTESFALAGRADKDATEVIDSVKAAKEPNPKGSA